MRCRLACGVRRWHEPETETGCNQVGNRRKRQRLLTPAPGSADEKDFCSGKDGDAVEKAEHASKPSRSKQGFSREGRARKHEWSRELQLDTANRTEATRRPTEHQSITGNLPEDDDDQRRQHGKERESVRGKV
jgi:hypothetical protein